MARLQKHTSLVVAIGETTDMFAGLASSGARGIENKGALNSLAVPPARRPVEVSTTQDSADGHRDKQRLQQNRRQQQGKRAPATKRGPVGRNKAAQIDHLAAARKLQWQLRRTRSHSPEGVKTGRLICRHLLAMLNEAATTSQGLNKKASGPELGKKSA